MNALFSLKKLIGFIIAPLPLAITLLIIGLFLTYRKNKHGLTISSIGLAVLLIFSLPITSNSLLKPFEFAYPKLPEDTNQFQYIVVLGCWHNNDDTLPLVAKLDQCSLTRVVQAVQFWRNNTDATVIFSGYTGRLGMPSHPEVNSQLAKSLGLPANKIHLSVGNKDTADEAKSIKRIVEDTPFILISSASHFPRAMKLFQQQGLQPIPSPAEYLSGNNELDIMAFLPHSNALHQSERAIYETLGNIWIRIKQLFD